MEYVLSLRSYGGNLITKCCAMFWASRHFFRQPCPDYDRCDSVLNGADYPLQ